jgi:hypothetical protein
MTHVPKSKASTAQRSISRDIQSERTIQTVCMALTLAVAVLAARIASIW